MRLTTSGGQTAPGPAETFGGTVYVDGIGLVATRGDGVRQIRPGDVVYIEPGEEHWHGATHDRYTAHVSIQEADASGTVVTWLQQVTHDEYGAPAAGGG